MQQVQLNNGTMMPALGFGLWKIKDEQECKTAVKTALEVGYRHLDTAQIYGNEAFVGEAVEEFGLPRKELFITTKIWNENQWWGDLIPSFDESLEKLRTNYVDLLLVHFPVTETRGSAWRRMEEVAKQGRAKAIGVSNYTIKHLEELLSTCSIKPAVNQVELHVYLQQPELVAFCRKHDIVVEAYSPLAHGEGLDNSVLQDLAAKHGKTPAQIMLRWCLEVGTVPLPKSVTPARIKQNSEVFDFTLDKSDMAALKKLNKNMRTCWDPTNVP